MWSTKGEYVWVVDEQNVLQARPVTPGQLHGGLRVVGTGLTADDWVVVSDVGGLRPGMTVKPDFGKGLADRSPALRPGWPGVAAAEQFVDLLSRGEFQKAAERFDDTMKKLVPPAELKKMWEQLDRAGGKFLARRGQVAGPGIARPTARVRARGCGNTTRSTSRWCLTLRRVGSAACGPCRPKGGAMPPGNTTTASAIAV